MSTSIKLNVAERATLGSASARRARKAGVVPSIIYGLNKKPKHIEINGKELEKVLSHDVSVITLVAADGVETNALVKDVQYNYLAAHMTHVDFLEIDMNAEIVASVPVYPHGTPAGLAQNGVLDQYVHEIEVSCLPADLPVSISAEVSHLQLDESLHLKEIKMPDKVKAVGDEDQVIFHVGLPKVKTEETEKSETAEGEAAEGETAEKGEAAQADDHAKKEAK